MLRHLIHTCSLTSTALLSESVACRRQICKPANVSGGDHPGRGGSGDEPGGRIAAGDTAELRGRRRQASRTEVFRMSACTRERRPSYSVIGYTLLRNRMTLTCISMQGCSPRDRGLGLESTRDQFYVVLVLVLRVKVLILVLALILMVLVLVSVVKGRSRKVSRPAMYVAM